MTRKYSELRVHMSPESLARAEAKAREMLKQLTTNQRAAIHEGMTSGPAVPADDVLAAVNARFAGAKPARRSGGKRRT
ncbi:MAG: hypothetical protein ACKVP2_15835 [Burkholderiales bacterium]